MSTYALITSATLGSNTSQWYIGGINSSYTDLQIWLRARLSDATLREFGVYFNTTTPSGSDPYMYLRWDSGASTMNGFASGNPAFAQTATNSTTGIHLIYVNNASSTTLYKSFSSWSNIYNNCFESMGNIKKTAALSSIGFTVNANNIQAGSKVWVYGINKT